MRTIFNLFARSPFAHLKKHMEKVAQCVHCLPDLFHALKTANLSDAENLSKQISDLEKEADHLKNEIRNHLSKSMVLAIDRNELLEILTLQDSIADCAEDISVLISLYPLTFNEEFEKAFWLFLHKNLETFNDASHIVNEMHELLESSFGGLEASKVNEMIQNVSVHEHEADLIQRDLLKSLFQCERTLSPSAFYLWGKIFDEIGSLSNLSKKLAKRMRTTLEIS